jgi:hypothetical protein
VPADQVDIVLAADNAGNASAWVKHFASGDTTGGFVRIWDIWMNPETIPNLEDLVCVAEYSLPANPYSVDFNDDYKVDIEDLLMLIEYWGTDNSLCDITPTAWGDGVVDVQDLEILMGYWGQELDDPYFLVHWKLDETEGIFACDSVGDNDGTLMGIPVWQPDDGRVDGALELNGMTFLVADFVLNPAEGPFSVLAWVQGGAPGQAIISQRAGYDWLSLDPATGALMTELRSGGHQSKVLHSDVTVTDDNWHRVGFTWDGSNRRLYVDDILVAEDTDVALAGCDGGVNIGCGSIMAPNTFFTGLIDDVRIYNRAVKP